MKSYTITVNGRAYDVTVAEKAAGAAPVAAPAPAPVAAPAPAPAPAPAAPAGAGAEVIASPMPGKILGVKASVGQAVKMGQVIILLEAMKMENEIVAPKDGVIASIDVATGASVEPGQTLATMN